VLINLIDLENQNLLRVNIQTAPPVGASAVILRHYIVTNQLILSLCDG